VLEDVMGGACSMDVRNEKLMHIRLKTWYEETTFEINITMDFKEIWFDGVV
jgi:hypothetical protein